MNKKKDDYIKPMLEKLGDIEKITRKDKTVPSAIDLSSYEESA